MNFERFPSTIKVASLVERKARFAVLFRNNNRSSTHFINKQMDGVDSLPQPARQSITLDRSFEFRSWRKLKQCMTKGIGRELEQTRAPIHAARHATGGALPHRAVKRNMKAICDRLNDTPESARDGEPQRKPSQKR